MPDPGIYLCGVPVIASVLRKAKAPRAFSVLNENAKGRLTITLLHEIAVLVQLMVYDQRKSTAFARDMEGYLLDLGGPSYHRALEIAAANAKTLNALEQKAADCERRAIRRGFATTEMGVQKEPVSDPLSSSFGWLPIPQHGDPEVYSYLKNEYKTVTLACKDARAQHELAQEQVRTMRAGLSVPEEVVLAEIRKWKFPVVDFSLMPDFQTAGTITLLRLSEPEWWGRVTQEISKSMNTLSPLRYILRDAVLLEFLGEKYPEYSQDEAIERHLKQNGSNWTVLSASDKSIKCQRQRMRREDKATREWIDSIGGQQHPLHPYRPKNAMVEKDLLLALNELQWFLARKAPPETFEPLCDLNLSRETINEHLDKWWKSSRSKN